MQKKDRGLLSVWQVVKLQLLVGIICSLFVFIYTLKRNDFISALLGILIALLPTIVYIKIAFKHGTVNYPKNALKQHKKAVMARFLLSLLLFMLIFVYFKHCNFLILFIIYIIELGAYWLNLLK